MAPTTFTVTGTVAAGATGSLANTATVSVGAGVTDPVSGNNTATDTDTLTPTADLVITKTDGATTEIPGTSVTYTIVASNAGPSTITGSDGDRHDAGGAVRRDVDVRRLGRLVVPRIGLRLDQRLGHAADRRHGDVHRHRHDLGERDRFAGQHRERRAAGRHDRPDPGATTRPPTPTRWPRPPT